MKTLILLIDFYGHPALTTDRYNDKIDFLNTENKNLRKELTTLRKDNDKIFSIN